LSSRDIASISETCATTAWTEVGGLRSPHCCPLSAKRRVCRRPAGDCYELRARPGAPHGTAAAAGPPDSETQASAGGQPARSAATGRPAPLLRGPPLALPRPVAERPAAAAADAPAGRPAKRRTHGAVAQGRGEAPDSAAPVAMDVDGPPGADRAGPAGAPGRAGAGKVATGAEAANGGAARRPGVGARAEGGRAASGNRAANGHAGARGGRGGGGEEEGDGRAAATLADAWREDASVGPVLRAVQEVFGDALLPYAPAPLAALFL